MNTDETVKCGMCKKGEEDDSGGEKWIECSNGECNQWYHGECIGIPDPEENSVPWYCNKCAKLEMTRGGCDINGESGTKGDSGGKVVNISSDDEADDRQQLQIMTGLIKEKEELCRLKEKQLEIISKLSNTERNKDVANWIEHSKEKTVLAGSSKSISQASNKFKPSSKPQKVLNSTSEKEKDNSKNNSVMHEMSILFKRQIQLMSQQYLVDLPEFNGDVEMWPVFYQQFISTTIEGGFDDSFNLIRLRKALKGEARQAVIGILSMPNCVADVLKILEKRYGTQDVIVKTKLKKLAELQQPNESKPHTIRAFFEFLLGLVATLKNVNALNYLHSPQTLDAVIEKLPANILRQWIRYRGNTNRVSRLDDFISWFEPFYDCANEYDKFSTARPDTSKRSSQDNRVNIHEEQHESTTAQKSGEATKCGFCGKEKHSISRCNAFKKKSTRDRWTFVRRKGLCFCCLMGKHRYENCETKKMCGIADCNDFHHQLLHYDKNRNTNSNNSQSASNDQLSAVTSSEDKCTHFRSLPVTLFNPINNKYVNVWAFLDEGSSPTMISSSVADELELTGEVEEFCTMWTDDSVRKECNSRRVVLQICGVGLDRRFTLKNVRTVSCLKLPMPTPSKVLSSKYNHLKDVNIPDIPIARPSILIGLEHAKLGIMYDIREGGWNEPIATKTRLGWVIHGKESGNNHQQYSCHVCECNKHDDNLANLMRSFHSTESFGVNVAPTLEAVEDTRAKLILEKTTRYTGERYITGLLWKDDDVQLPDSRMMALQRFKCFEQKLNRDASLKLFVTSKMQDHINKGYLVKLASSEIPDSASRHWYLPIFSIQNLNKPDKPRLVFDAAAKSHGMCLNDMLLKGPELTASLFGIILRVRQRRIAVAADIAEMFHRIEIAPEDQMCQLVFWRDECDKENPIDVYKMTRMTFGAKCSPCSAQYVLQENAKNFTEKYPRAVEAVMKSHYVDDLLESFDSVDEAIEVSRQIYEIHHAGGFFIRNWISNSQIVANHLRGELHVEPRTENMNLCKDAIPDKILGMYWATDTDDLVFKVNTSKVNADIISKSRLPTKREMLKVIMSQFDPLGILAPLIIYAKILMQAVWKNGGDWDDPVPSILESKWHEWLDALEQLKHLKVPRWYFREVEHERERLVLHIFADASEEAFASVAFVQVKSNCGYYASFIASKTRVAPQKSLSIPRLELQAAVLATRLKNTIVSELGIDFDDIVFWTDSQTVNGWIRSTTRKYSSFVSNRVSEILDSSSVQQWRWLPGKENVADEATRALASPIISTRWLNGPKFLSECEVNWSEENSNIITSTEEIKSTAVHQKLTSKLPFIDLSRFSKWERLLRCVAYVLRFVNKLKFRSSSSRHVKLNPVVVDIPALSSNELDAAEKVLFKIVQHDHYASEIESLSSPTPHVSRKSPIFNFNPIIGDDGLMRMSGRIEAAPVIVNESLKKPIILSRDHVITNLLIDAIHRKFHHLNKEYVVNQIRQYLWIPKVRVQVNKVISNCNFCKNRRAQPIFPRMGPLPQSRLQPFQPPFTCTGIDLFGPIEITIGRRHEKRWGVLFVCLSMRAIHLELAASLDTSSAILCLRNFMNRRGPPLEIVSDNGTNLRGAEAELKRAVQEIDFNRIQDEVVSALPNEIRSKWTFIPPSAPHHGGSWERMVRTVKESLYIILRDKYPREDTLRSALIEIENLVNSRPLNYSSNEVGSAESITPNHLLRGSGRQVIQMSGEFNCRKQWKVAQSLADEFWTRWLNEYLPTITHRPKWRAESKPVQIDQLVFIIDSNVPRGEWRRGLISKIFPSKDGRIRTVEVRTSTGNYIRPVTKLAIVNMNADM